MKNSGQSVLFVINSLCGGGAEQVFATLINHIQPYLQVDNCRVLLLDQGQILQQIDAPIVIDRLGSNGGWLDSLLRFRRYMAQLQPDVVVSFLTRANGLAAAFARRHGYRCIVCERSDTGERLGRGAGGWLKRWLVRRLYGRAHAVLTVSAGIKSGLERHYGLAADLISVIHNPCDPDQLQRLATQPRPRSAEAIQATGFIASMGRLVPCKCFDLLIRAYAAGNFPVPLVIIGDGPLRDELQTLARQLGVAARVHFPGYLSNPFPLLAQASVYVLCSSQEGFPNSLVEAMALGLPVIASNCRHGPGEILDEQVLPAVQGVYEAKHGVLVPVGDEAALTLAVRRVLQDAVLRRFMAQQARHRASQFALGQVISRYADAINSQLQATGGAV